VVRLVGVVGVGVVGYEGVGLRVAALIELLVLDTRLFDLMCLSSGLRALLDWV